MEYQFPYDEQGVDLSVIQWTLSLTPAERLQTLQEFVDFVSYARERDASKLLACHSGSGQA
jgi:hypothetical protein